MERQRKGAEEQFRPEAAKDERIGKEDHQRIERLFEQATRGRSKTYELKSELDRLDVFKEYEDRFLDLFKPPAKFEGG